MPSWRPSVRSIHMVSSSKRTFRHRGSVAKVVIPTLHDEGGICFDDLRQVVQFLGRESIGLRVFYLRFDPKFSELFTATDMNMYRLRRVSLVAEEGNGNR